MEVSFKGEQRFSAYHTINKRRANDKTVCTPQAPGSQAEFGNQELRNQEPKNQETLYRMC